MANTSSSLEEPDKTSNRIYDEKLCGCSRKGSGSYVGVWRSDRRSIVDDAC